MTELSYTHVIPSKFLKDFKEELWVAGSVVREAWCIELPEAQPIIQDVIDNFPEYTKEMLTSIKSNMIGYASNYRPPYTNGCVSWYEWEYPSDQDQAKYNIQIPSGCKMYRWYGKKFDMSSKQVWLKYVFREIRSNSFPYPTLPINSKNAFFAQIADEAGNVLPEIDVYFNCPWKDVKSYCLEHNLEYPAPPPEEEVKMKLWAFVYDLNTMQISKVKGYRIFNVNKR